MPGAWPPPWPASEKNAGGRNHRFSRDIPAFPARWLGGLYVLSPGTGLSCPRDRRIITASVTSASGGQDHTISPAHQARSSA